MLHRLAERMNRSVEELERMRADEVRDWLEFWKPEVRPAPTSIKDLFR